MKPRLLSLDERDPLPAPGSLDRLPLPITRSRGPLPLPDAAWDDLWGEQEVPDLRALVTPPRREP